ncbi:MAG: TIM barrel protein [Candidatus Hodarchaeales archaeon]
MNLSLGISLGFSRFLSQERAMSKIQKINKANLNSVEFGLLNCAIGQRNFPGIIPFPTEKQAKSILSLFGSKKHYFSVHAPYRISATTEEESKLKYSKSNLSATLKVTDLLNGHHVTFHAGSFKKKHNNKHVEKILKNWEDWRQEKGYKAIFAPEVGGKYNSFADFFTLVEITGGIDNCLMTWDISHDFARGGKIIDEEGILNRLEKLDQAFNLSPSNRLPMHFSGMVVGKTGEKHHTLLGKGNGVPWELVFSVLKEQNFLSKVNLICESKVPKGEKLNGDAISDALKVRRFLESDRIVKQYKGKPGNLDFYFN